MIKYIGIFILASSLSVYGSILSSSLKACHSLRKEIIQLLKSIERGIQYGSIPSIQIIRNCRLPLLVKSGFCDSFSGSENAEIVVNSSLKSLSQKDREMLCSFFSKLGKSAYSEQELKHCRYFIDYFEKTQAESEKETNSKVQLYKKIGLIVGILSAIIFI